MKTTILAAAFMLSTAIIAASIIEARSYYAVSAMYCEDGVDTGPSYNARFLDRTYHP